MTAATTCSPQQCSGRLDSTPLYSTLYHNVNRLRCTPKREEHLATRRKSAHPAHIENSRRRKKRVFFFFFFEAWLACTPMAGDGWRWHIENGADGLAMAGDAGGRMAGEDGDGDAGDGGERRGEAMMMMMMMMSAAGAAAGCDGWLALAMQDDD